MTEHLHDLKPPRSTMEVIQSALSKLDNEPFTNPEERARRFTALLSLDGYQVLQSIPMPRAVR